MNWIQKWTSAWKNKHDFLYFLEKIRQTSQLEVKLLLKFDQPEERKVANLPPKEPQTRSLPEGGKKTLTMMIIDYDDDDDDEHDDDEDNNDDDE